MPMRYDRIPVKTVKTDEGFYYDPAAVLTRTGIFDYRDPATGQISKEYRPPDEVFRADHLDSLKDVVIISGKHRIINSTNSKGSVDGIITGAGRQDGDNLVAPVKIWNTEPVDVQGLKEFSLCYEIDLDPTPGIAPNGERYDAVQRNIRKPNHLLLCKSGRAGVARLNMDAADDETEAEPEVKTKELVNMSKIRIDNGIEYDAAPEVAVYIGSLIKSVADVTKERDGNAARADAAEAKTKDLEKQLITARGEGESAARARLQLEATAKSHKVEFKSDTSDKDLRIAIVKKIRGDSFDPSGKTDAYLEVAYDLAIGEAQARDDANASQRAQLRGNPPVQATKTKTDANDNGETVVDSVSARDAYKARISGVK